MRVIRSAQHVILNLHLVILTLSEAEGEGSAFQGRYPMPRVCHFEINADDIDRASAFYRDVFGWKIEKWQGPFDYWMVMTGDEEPGIDGGMMKRPHPGATIVNTISVPSVDEYTEKVKAKGGKIVMEKMPIPEVGYMAYFLDTEGNPFGIMEGDPSAK